MTQKRVGLHMWELGSTVWIHFCLQKSIMLWLICTFSSFMYGSVGEVERRSSRSTMNRLVMSVRLGAKFGIWPWGM